MAGHIRTAQQRTKVHSFSWMGTLYDDHSVCLRPPQNVLHIMHDPAIIRLSSNWTSRKSSSSVKSVACADVSTIWYQCIQVYQNTLFPCINSQKKIGCQTPFPITRVNPSLCLPFIKLMSVRTPSVCISYLNYYSELKVRKTRNAVDSSKCSHFIMASKMMPDNFWPNWAWNPDCYTESNVKD